MTSRNGYFPGKCRFQKTAALNVRSRLHYSSGGVGSIRQRRAAAGPECVKTLSYRACFSPLLLDVVISRLFTTISAGNASERV